MDQPPTQWRPLLVGDIAFLLDLNPRSVKQRLKRGNFPEPTWVGAGTQRVWAWCVIEQWAQEERHPLRTLDELDAYIARRR